MVCTGNVSQKQTQKFRNIVLGSKNLSLRILEISMIRISMTNGSEYVSLIDQNIESTCTLQLNNFQPKAGSFEEQALESQTPNLHCRVCESMGHLFLTNVSCTHHIWIVWIM